MTITIIGIDCATQSKNLGLALGHFHNDWGRLEQVSTGSLERSATNTIANWMRLNTTTLLALDSPLGWPIDLGESLYAHEAGQPIYREANKLFRRHLYYWRRFLAGSGVSICPYWSGHRHDWLFGFVYIWVAQIGASHRATHFVWRDDSGVWPDLVGG